MPRARSPWTVERAPPEGCSFSIPYSRELSTRTGRSRVWSGSLALPRRRRFLRIVRGGGRSATARPSCRCRRRQRLRRRAAHRREHCGEARGRAFRRSGPRCARAVPSLRRVPAVRRALRRDPRPHGLRGRRCPPGRRGALDRRDFRAALAPRRSAVRRRPGQALGRCCAHVPRARVGGRSSERLAREVRGRGEQARCRGGLAPRRSARGLRRSQTRGSPGCGSAHLRAAPGGGSHHCRFDLRGVALAHHRRVGLHRGRARAARSPGRGCSGARLAAALGRARAGAHRLR